MPQQPDNQPADGIPVREAFPDNPIADKLFSDDPISPAPAPEKTEEVRVADDTVPPPAKPKEPVETPPVDDEEIDWDETDPKPSEGDLDLESDPPNETEARKQAKLRGREAKRLKAELEEIRLEKERIAEERDKLKTKAEEYAASTLDPTQHPEFTALRNDILNDVANAAELMQVSDSALVVNNFGQFMNRYLSLEGLPAKDRTEKLNELRGFIVDTVAAPDVPYADMTPEEQAQYANVASDVLRVVQRNVRSTKQLGELKSSLENKAKSGVLLRGVREYENTIKEFQPILDTIGELPDDIIEADPHSPASVVASMLKKNPEAKKKVEAAKRDALEIITGPRPLTLDEIHRLESGGTDVKRFLAEREQRHREKQKRLLPILVQGLVTRAAFRAAMEELAQHRKKNSASEEELDALRSIGKAKPLKEAPAEKPKVPAVEKLFLED